MRIAILVAALCFASFSNAEARSRHHVASAQLSEGCNVLWPCIVPQSFKADVRGPLQPQMFTRKKQSNVDVIGSGLYLNPTKAVRGMGNALAGLVAPLAAKASEIIASCGSRSLGGVSHRNIAGTRILSLHATGQAVDLQGNPSCIYAHLAGWPGGYSIDYARAPNAQHVHISYTQPGGREWGVRFAHRHYGGRHRYAHRRHRHAHYANAHHE